MTSTVRVIDQIYERQGFKTVQTVDGRVEEVPPGRLPDPGSEILARDGEPNLRIQLSSEINGEQDLPAELSGALSAMAARLYNVTRGGRENPDDDGDFSADDGEWKTIEWVGSAVQDGAIVLLIDTDGTGFTPGMIDALVRVVSEELERIGAEATISVASPVVT